VEDGKINGILGVPRSFGDLETKKTGALISTPVVTVTARQKDDDFVLIGSKGVLNGVSSQSFVSDLKALLLKRMSKDLDL
jgi:hypothetical protein